MISVNRESEPLTPSPPRRLRYCPVLPVQDSFEALKAITYNHQDCPRRIDLPPRADYTIFTPEEIEIIRTEAFSTFPDGKRKYQQAAAYFLMLNTGLRTGEALGLVNSDIDLENRMLHIRRSVKKVSKRNGSEKQSGREKIIGKPKSATSIREIPLNSTAIEMIKDLREEMYFGEDSPLIPDENGEFTKPSNFRKRFYHII
jgi:integrase